MATARQRIWGWWFYDWASQPYNTLLLTFIFGPYFAEIARGYYMGPKVADADYQWWTATFDKMLADLTERQKSGMKLDDILALANLRP